MQWKHWMRTKTLGISLVLVCAVLITGFIAWPDLFQGRADAKIDDHLSRVPLADTVQRMGLNWHGQTGDTPTVVDFGGAPADAPIAGLDQWLAEQDDGHLVPAANVTGTKKVMVLRVYFNDYNKTSRYSKSDVEDFFKELNQLWKNTSYNNIDISYQVTDLFQLPDDRSDYIDDEPTGDLSKGNKFWKVLDDAIDNSPSGLDWTDLDAVMVVMAETDSSQFHRGQGTGSCNLKMGPGGSTANVGCAIFSENPSDSDRQVWGRWAHEIGHAFQQSGPAHPSNYNSEFELMDSNYPGQTGVFEKQGHTGFPGWMPAAKYVNVSQANGGETLCLWAEEYDPTSQPNPQAIKAEITGNLYYLISVRRRVLGDDLNGDFANGIPDEGVLIERVSEGSDPWVTVKGKGGNRNALWKVGDSYSSASDGIQIIVESQQDKDNYCVTVRYNKSSYQPDVMVNPWLSAPGNTWETTDIWVDSPVNGYDTYRYGSWSDGTGNTVPRGNGDDPAINQVNRLYARVRNIGTSPATDVVVNWEITDPPGVGIAGANGWASLGSVDKNDFPGLANIAPGDFVDVYVEWTPNFPVSDEDLQAGRFAFHTCVRVKLNHVSGETVFGNQDGDREQENISYFQAVQQNGSNSVYDEVIRLHNDDLANPKFFYLTYKNELPDNWIVDINHGERGFELAPNEVREIPVLIKPKGQAAVGSVFGVDVSASSLRLLENDLNPKDKHPDFDPLGGVRVEARVLLPAKIGCRAQNYGEIVVEGELSGVSEFYNQKNPPKVMIQGVDGNRNLLHDATQVVRVNSDGGFQGSIYSQKPRIEEVICLFAGTTEVASAGSGYVPVSEPSESPPPTPTRTAEPTWTPKPTATPTPGPTPTPTPLFSLRPYKSSIIVHPPTIIGSTDLSFHSPGIEITQGIQCFDTSNGLAGCADNSVKVVTNKSTTARVYVKFSNTFLSSRNNVPVRLYMRQDHGAWHFMDTTAKALATLDQSDADNSANFFFTISAASSSVVDFYAVVDPDDTINETNEDNNRYPGTGYVTLTFHPSQELTILGQRLDYHPSGYTGTRRAGGWAVNGGGARWFNQLLPIGDNDVNYSVASGFRDWTTSLSTGSGQHDLIKTMNGEYVLALIFTLLFGGSPNDLPNHIYGWAPNDGYTGGHADMPVYPHAGGLGVVAIGTDRPGSDTDNPGGGALIFGHELIHDYDVYHTNTGADDCGSNDSNSDFPYGTSSIQEFGFNPLTAKVYDPANTHDVMSYCPAQGTKEGWISPFTWNKMFGDLSASAAAASEQLIAAGPSGVGALYRTQSSQSLIVNATIYNPDVSDQQGGDLGELYLVDSGYNLVLPEGDYTVELRNAATVLASRSFVVNFESEYDGHAGGTNDTPPFPAEPTAQVDVSFVMPWVDGTTSVALLYKGEVLDQRTVSGLAPQVTITSPSQKVTWEAGSTQTIEWQATDADSESLVYAVFYSNDAGQNWQLLASELSETRYSVDVDSLAGGSDTRFRVVATDGVNTGYDETDAPIVVPNKAPEVVILEPASGRMVQPNSLVVFEGTATDMEDGTLAAENLQWRSDRQGSLGHGQVVPFSELEAGEHTITLIATDRYGSTSTSSVKITVGFGIYLPQLSN